MRDATGSRALRIALAGNPNSGKTTLFNALTGARHKVGNYPGVTVEKREGSRFRRGREYRFVDLPGIYSLTAYSIDEVVARDFLLEDKPDVIVDVLDSTNLERHLYLCLQFQELGIPVIGALNMSDEARAKGIDIDAARLGKLLGIPMVKTVGPKGGGIEELLDLVDASFGARGGERADGAGREPSIRYGTEIEERLGPLEAAVAADEAFAARCPPRWLAVKLLEKDANARERLASHRDGAEIAARADGTIAWLEGHFGKDSEILLSEQRYGYIRGATRETVSSAGKANFNLTEAIDAVIMNRFLALPVFVAVMWGIFQLTFALGAYPLAWLEDFFAWLAGAASNLLGPGLVRSLVVDGIIGGVGGVFSFVPLIVILFFFLSLLEDVGYMSRAAFASDKLLHAFGLHGQSVFPLMLGFGCSVPAIMAARTLKSPRDRIATVLVIPFMSCGAKLPVYVLLAAAFFPENPANAVMATYAAGVALSLLSALALKRTVLRGEPTPFVMELPPYRAPTLRGLLWHVGDKTLAYVRKMGTVIMAASILIWAITTFPVYAPGPGAGAAAGTARAEAALEHSAAGRIGKFLEPAFAPLGLNWKIGAATITGFAAKELMVSTLGILYGVGNAEPEGGESLRAALVADPGFGPLAAFVLMLFTLVIPPCFAALAAIRSELGWKWLGFAFGFMLALGWLLGFAVFRVGSALGLGG